MQECYELLDRLGLRDRYAHRVDLLKIGMSFCALSKSEINDPAILSQLVDQVKDNLKTVLILKDEPLPASLLATQIIQQCDQSNIEVCSDVKILLAQVIELTGTNSASLIRLVSRDEITAVDLLERIYKTEPARYSSDVGYDVHIINHAARILLASKEAAINPYVAAFAAELMTDHGLTMPKDQLSEEERSQWFPSSIDEPGQQLIELSLRGMTVILLAFDEREQLVRITIEKGLLHPTVYEEEDVFSAARFREWSKKFPYSYGIDNNDCNLFYNTMQGLSLTQPTCSHAIVILDTQLQNLTPQLLLVQDELFGRNTKVAIAPSVTWIHATLTSYQPNRSTSVAWISTAVNNNSDGTLAMVASRLEDTLTQYSIELNTNDKIPDNFEGAELAIIAAHGGVARNFEDSEHQYFQRVSDENKLKMSSVSLSRALKNVGVAVLFICSGGRYDKHPNASTAIGLPKELLDRGCQAVIASPWPLDSRVPSHWLPAFLQAWNAGEMLIDANYKANKAVEIAMGNSPELCLAMTVYGNPLLVKQAC